jgi:hypothetical protein
MPTKTINIGGQEFEMTLNPVMPKPDGDGEQKKEPKPREVNMGSNKTIMFLVIAAVLLFILLPRLEGVFSQFQGGGFPAPVSDGNQGIQKPANSGGVDGPYGFMTYKEIKFMAERSDKCYQQLREAGYIR